MAEIADRESLRAWLEDKPREVAVAIAARSALRVAPLLVIALDRHAERRRAALILPAFRALAVASLAANWTRLATDDAAARAATRAADAVDSDAARAAAHAAAAAFADAAAFAVQAVANAARAAAGAAAHAASYADAARIWRAVSADCTLLDEALGAEDTARRLWPEPLWSGREPPPPLSVAWQALKEHLLAAAEDWEVWTRWYEDRLDGRRGIEALDLARATIPDDDWLKGPAHVNAIIAEQIEEHARKQTPVVREIEIDRASGNIVARTPGQRRLETDEGPIEQVAARHRARIERDIVRLRNEENNAPFHMAWPALDSLQEVLSAPFDPEDWHDEIEGARLEIDLLKRSGYLPSGAPEIERFRETLDRAAYALKERYPRLALADEARRAQRLRRLDEAEVRALEAALEAFADIVDSELRKIVSKDISAARSEQIEDRADPAAALPIPESKLKIRLYRLRGTFLRIRQLAHTSPEKLRRIFDMGAEAAKKIVQYEKAAETLDRVWGVLRDWMLGGGAGS
jgi:hypothetical protein